MAYPPIPGDVKYDIYKYYFDQLKKAMENEFYLEAIFIEYAILEDRTESVLHHAGLWNDYMAGRRQSNIGTKLTYIKKKAQAKSSSFHRYFSDNLLDQLREWKNKRNPLIHDLLNQTLGDDDLKNLALEGYDLIRELRNRATDHNRTLEKKYGK